MPENLKLTEPVLTRYAGYFYTLSDTTDTLFKLTDSGDVAFSYPLDTNITNTVQSLQYDGRYFYTLENVIAGNGTLLIKRWEIEDFVLRLKRTYTLTGNSSQKYDSNAFAVEHYELTITGTVTSGSSSLSLVDASRLVIGDNIYFGPSSFTGDTGEFEQRTINTVSGNNITLTAPITTNFNSGDKAVVSNRIWFFNKFRPSDTDPTNGSGELYSFDLNPVLTTVIPRKAGNEFRTVIAASYIKDPNYGVSGRDFLVYANQTNLLFIETTPTNPQFLNTVQSLVQSNQEINSNVIPIFEVTSEGNTIFRLQLKATYRTGSTLNTETWTRYSYQVSTMTRLPTSIGLTASPALISANGLATSSIKAVVRDQANNPMPGKTVTFSDDDVAGSPAGSVAPTSDVTDANGEAETTYTSGTVPKTVQITATTT